MAMEARYLNNMIVKPISEGIQYLFENFPTVNSDIFKDVKKLGSKTEPEK